MDDNYDVARNSGTERPFTGKYWNTHEKGIYKRAICGNELFSPETKFDSGTGWPSFDQAVPGSIKEIEDNSYGMQRTEVVCSVCESHLGHVFDDGPTDTGKRYCVNAVCLQWLNFY